MDQHKARESQFIFLPLSMGYTKLLQTSYKSHGLMSLFDKPCRIQFQSFDSSVLLHPNINQRINGLEIDLSAREGLEKLSLCTNPFIYHLKEALSFFLPRTDRLQEKLESPLSRDLHQNEP